MTSAHEGGSCCRWSVCIILSVSTRIMCFLVRRGCTYVSPADCHPRNFGKDLHTAHWPRRLCGTRDQHSALGVCMNKMGIIVEGRHKESSPSTAISAGVNSPAASSSVFSCASPSFFPPCTSFCFLLRAFFASGHAAHDAARKLVAVAAPSCQRAIITCITK